MKQTVAKIHSRRGVSLIIGLGLVSFMLLGLTNDSIPKVFHYTDLPQVREFAKQMQRKHDIPASAILSVLRKAKPQPHVLEQIAKPAEKTLLWSQYRKIFIQPKRIADGHKWYRQHQEWLEKAEGKYKVPGSIVVGIIGIETFYGKYMGKYRVFESLATLAFEPNNRQKFFRSELESFFLLAYEQKLNPMTIYGSYAGAIGFGQFIPSSYLHYAIDFDGDNVANLINNRADAMGSIAHYLHKHKWEEDVGIAWPIELARPASEQEQQQWQRAQKPKKSLEHFLSTGLIKKDSLPASIRQNTDIPVSIVYLPEKQGGKYWIGTRNYYAITRYNHSNLYAMAVIELAKQIEQYGQAQP